MERTESTKLFHGFNRTKVELKYGTFDMILGDNAVLIVPRWN